jgi:site-specific recombinase XerC
LKYRLEVDHISTESKRLEESRLGHLLQWANDRSFDRLVKIRPTFPEYVLIARKDGKREALSPVYVEKLIRSAYRFLKWLNTHRKGYAELNQAYLDTLRPPRMTIEAREHEAVTIEEIRAIAQAPAMTVGERRIRAAAVFLFLSGMRIGAFVSLPLAAVDLDHLTVKQWPKLGVRTKFRKHATTYLLSIPDLLAVFREWEKEVKAVCDNKGLWFAQISDVGKIIPGAVTAGQHRTSIATRDLRNWLRKVHLPYHSPHKFRHGNAVYSIKLAKDIAALKAISQNLMHSNLSITDGVYGILSDNDVRENIAALDQRRKPSDANDIRDLIIMANRILNKLSAKNN